MRQIYVSLMILGWFAVPSFVIADWSTYSQRSWTDRHTVDRGLLERDSLIHRVESPTVEDHFGLMLGRDRVKKRVRTRSTERFSNSRRGYALLRYLSRSVIRYSR